MQIFKRALFILVFAALANMSYADTCVQQNFSGSGQKIVSIAVIGNDHVFDLYPSRNSFCLRPGSVIANVKIYMKALDPECSTCAAASKTIETGWTVEDRGWFEATVSDPIRDAKAQLTWTITLDLVNYADGNTQVKTRQNYNCVLQKIEGKKDRDFGLPFLNINCIKG